MQEQQQGEQLQWKRRFEAMEKARMSELEDEWARREEERSSLLRLTQSEYERLEKALRTSLLELEARERRLAIAENTLQREQQTQRDEAEQFRKRLQNDHTHALSLASKQADAQEQRIALLETQLSDAEKRARQVEADFGEYRLQQRKVPESRLREEISALKGAILEVEKQKMQQEREKDAAEAHVATLKLQLEKLAKLVQQEKKKNETRVAEELEKLRVKYVAREEKYVLDGDREELRAIKKQLDELKGLNLRPTGGYDDFVSLNGSTSVRSNSSSQHYEREDDDDDEDEMDDEFDDHDSDQEDEIEAQLQNNAADLELDRLERERKLLLTSGAYNEQSFLVRELTRRIAMTKVREARHRHQEPLL
ncbi:Zinc finger, c2h2 [Globisporangium polare]